MTPEGSRIGRFRLAEKLGEGGMGVVHVALDEHLGRQVAIKKLRESKDPVARGRLLREARVAASVNHPNICQVYEIGEDTDELYLVMELIDGEPLDKRLGRGPMPLGEALQTILGLLAGLEALHRRELVHRDIKPSNVFLTPHGPKLLDFGLSRPLTLADEALQLTQTGMAVGTPRYMAPEQWAGEALTPASDLFALGALLFEMLAGQPAFAGKTILEVCEAITRRQPPALSGGAAIVAADRVIQRALEKNAAQRYGSAVAMAADVRAALLLLDAADAAPRVQRAQRFMAMPFRILRPDPETDFLAFSLADAIASSLSGLESLLVRSSLGATRFAADVPDLARIAREAEVDVVLYGTLLRAGEQIRVAVQLVAAPAGTLLWSKTLQVSLGDLFQLQDTLVHQIVESLAVPLSGQEKRHLAHDVPKSTRAYELYLRANQINAGTGSASQLVAACDLYRACLDADPDYAPAWARLGRVYRIMAKYGHADATEYGRLAQEAFDRALRLNPDLSIAHNYFTYLQVEERQAMNAMIRLLERGQNRAADPDLYAGLVVACRFCGLLEASVAADRRAKRLDPNIRTSVHYTHWMRGDYESAIAMDFEDPPYLRCHGHALLGQVAEVTAIMQSLRARGLQGLDMAGLEGLEFAIKGRYEDCLRSVEAMDLSAFHDPEGIFLTTRHVAYIGAKEKALNLFARVVDGGFWCHTTFAQDPWLDNLRGEPEFLRLLKQAEEGQRAAAAAYERLGGERLLGVPAH